MSFRSSNDHMGRVYKVSIHDLLSVDRSWEEHTKGTGINQLEPASISKA